MSNTQAYLELIFYLGLVLSLPFFFRVCILVGRLFSIYVFPPKSISIEIKRSDGRLIKKKINIADDEALVKAVLRSTGRVL
jgi:hypothetical protein